MCDIHLDSSALHALTSCKGNTFGYLAFMIALLQRKLHTVLQVLFMWFPVIMLLLNSQVWPCYWHLFVWDGEHMLTSSLLYVAGVLCSLYLGSVTYTATHRDKSWCLAGIYAVSHPVRQHKRIHYCPYKWKEVGLIRNTEQYRVWCVWV
jgi:hypothetical protein